MSFSMSGWNTTKYGNLRGGEYLRKALYANLNCITIKNDKFSICQIEGNKSTGFADSALLELSVVVDEL